MANTPKLDLYLPEDLESGWGEAVRENFETLDDARVIQDNLAATTAPSVTDDEGSGYEVGSVWIDITGDNQYICLDPSTGAAVWRRTTLVIGTDVQAWDADLDAFATKTAPSGDVVGTSDAQTLTAKRVTKRSGTVASSGTPTINTDNVDIYTITALAENITSMTTNLSGTPTLGQTLILFITDDGTSRDITWGASFDDGAVELPESTTISVTLRVLLMWDGTI